MTEQQFNNATVLYNPNGGKKLNKVYGIKGNDLSVTGGGGTRFNKEGKVETLSAGYPKINHSTGKPAFLLEPIRTNVEPFSYNLITSGSWSGFNAPTITLNQEGITGQPNTALLITDNSTTASAEVRRTLLAISGIVKTSTWLKKDSNPNPTVFPELAVVFRLASNNTVTLVTAININLHTGQYAFRSPNDNVVEVLDRGDWWEVVIISGQPTDRVANFILRPSVVSTLGGSFDTSLTGSMIVGHIGISNSSVTDETPIITNGGTVTRPHNYYVGNVPTIIEGGIYVHFLHRSIRDTENRYLYILTDSGNFVPSRNAIFINNNTLSFIGENGVSSNIMTLVEGQEYKTFLRFKTNDIKLFINGSVAATRTGTVSTTKNNLVIGNYGGSFAANRAIYSTIYDFRITQPLIDAEAITLTTL